MNEKNNAVSVFAQCRRAACPVPWSGTLREFSLQDYRGGSPCIIKAWWLRNLPPPVPGSHWTWMDGTYVMVTDDVGVIIRAISGDIFYSNRK
ncbi:RcnB family protein [Salmonella enterica subsp. enterica]|nr:RcnB family protein [Salmonella enterica subsp. enterica]